MALAVGYKRTVSRPSALRGVLLDIDGTLVLSNDAHAHAWVDAFREYGIAVRFEDVRALIGMGADKVIPALSPRLEADSGLGKQIADRRQQIFLSHYIREVGPAPGSRELCQALRDRGLTLPIASSAQAEELHGLLEVAQVADLVDPPNDRGKTPESKPAPDVVATALRRCGLKPESAVLLGDTPFDILAAARCGVATIAVRCGGWSDARLRDAIAIYDDPADLLAHLEDSPLANAALHSHRG